VPSMQTPTHRAQIVRVSSGASRWDIATRRPAPDLRHYVRDYTGYTEEASQPLRRRAFPRPQVLLLIDFRSPLRVFGAADPRRHCLYPGGFVAGLSDTVTITEHDGLQGGLAVSFTPVGARRFFGVPMAELADRVLSARDLLPGEHAHLPERLQDLPTWDARFDLMDHVLGERIRAARIETGVVSWASRQIEERRGAIDVRALAHELGYSQKHVVHMFREHVGVPPKRLARLVRFDNLIQHLRQGGSGAWAELAQRFGYYDQAHMANDVKHFTSTTPTGARAELIELARVFA
jgi:AraC-like DNA-binding protein